MPKTPFQASLRTWYQRHKRALPWRQSEDPYHIWLAEIILQQTRVAQGLPYYQKFVRQFPTVDDLARASEGEVMKLWEGLGYYSRARNLHAAAKTVAEDMGGKFPHSYDELLALKGVGDYTASAISSFVANEPRAVLDGNVYRVLARYFGVDTPINTSGGRKLFEQLAVDNLDRKDPATYNQAIMEFGALQCVPRKPSCEKCPLQESCMAWAEGRVGELPVKQRRHYNRQRFFYYLLCTQSDKVLVEQRRGKDIWRKLYQLPLLEYHEPQPITKVMAEAELSLGLAAPLKAVAEELPPHKLSHQTIHITILRFDADAGFKVESGEGIWQTGAELETLAFPRPLRQYLDRNQLTLPFS